MQLAGNTGKTVFLRIIETDTIDVRLRNSEGLASELRFSTTSEIVRRYPARTLRNDCSRKRTC